MPHSVQADMWEAHHHHHRHQRRLHPTSSSEQHDASPTLASPLPQPQPRPPPSHVTSAPPTKRITFFRSGDSQFGGVKMAVHRRSFKCFDALLDDLSQKVPLPFGVRTVTTPRGTHAIRRLDQLQDGACYLCSDHRRAKPVDMGLAGKRPAVWHPNHHHHHHPQHRHSPQAQKPDGAPSRQQQLSRRVLLVKNSEPTRRRSVVLGRRSARSLRAFLEEASDAMQFHVRRLYTAEGRKIDSVQSLMTCPGLLVCVGREPFSPLLVELLRKSSEERLPGLGTRSPGTLGFRTPGNGARSPATQGARSPTIGARSRGSEGSEGHESRKNVNLGLETKKSIIHPRSDSSTRSTRFSLSSEKSYRNSPAHCGHGRPAAITNDDIEKRVMVNKDGSLSVEMKVRFRLHSEETLQWSTQLKNATSLTNDYSASTTAPLCYLHGGHSETCSDPDSGSCDPEAAGVYADASLHRRPPAANLCPCCHQNREQQYDLWENPAHSNKHAPQPPLDGSWPAHARVRQTHSSSSSSSSHSRRVVCRRSRLSSSHGGSGSEQARVEVQEELCVTEEVCTVSHCCGNSGASGGDGGGAWPCDPGPAEDNPCQRAGGSELDLSEGEDGSPSDVSDTSHVLQALQEDQDQEEDELPPSASQCCQCEPSSTPASLTLQKGEDGGSRASSCHCRVATSRSVSKTSKVSCRSNKSDTRSPMDADDGTEDVQDRVMTSQSNGQSSACSQCGGCKDTTPTGSQASQRSGRSRKVTPQPDPCPEDQGGGCGDERSPSQTSQSSECSGVSLRSNKSNLTHLDCTSVMSNIPEERDSSALSDASSQRKDTGAPGTTQTEAAAELPERAVSAASASSQRSSRSHKSIVDVEERRCASTTSVKSKVSSRSCISHRSTKEAEKRVASALSCRSAASKHNGAAEGEDEGLTSAGSALQTNSSPDNGGNIDAVEEEIETLRPISVLSAVSAKSDVSARSTKSAKSHLSRCSKVLAPDPEDDEDAEEQQFENGERAASAMSASSRLSVNSNKSKKYTKASDRSLSPKPGDVENETERASTAMSARSAKSIASESKKSAKSCKSCCSRTPCLQVEVKAEDLEEENTVSRSGSVMSTKSAKSAKVPQLAKSSSSLDPNSGEVEEVAVAETAECAKDADRAASAMSVKSATSVRSGKGRKSNCDGETESDPKAGKRIEAEEGNDERVGSALSFKSAHSSRSGRTPKPTCVIHVTAESPAADEELGNGVDRSPSASSVRSSVKSSKSHKSSTRISSTTAVISTVVANGVEDQNEECLAEEDKQPAQIGLMSVGPEERMGSAMSVVSKCSERSGRSTCKKSKCRKCAKVITACPTKTDIFNIEATKEDNGDDTKQTSEMSPTKNGTALDAHSPEPLCNAAAHTPISAVAQADDQEDEPEEHPASTISSKTGSTVMGKHASNCGRSKSALSGVTKLARSPSPCKTPTPRASSPIPSSRDGETRGQSPTSVRSGASTKSRCRCGVSSKTQTRREESRSEDREDADTTEDKEPSERAHSVRSANSQRSRVDPGAPEELLRQESLGSVSLVLPEEEQGDSDEGECHVSSRTNAATSTNAGRADVSSVNPTTDAVDAVLKPADIPTIETPGGTAHSEKEEGRATERSRTANSSRSNVSVKSSKSNKSSTKSGTALSPMPKTEQNHESERAKSRSSARGGCDDENHREPSVKRSPSAMSGASGNVQGKMPSGANKADGKDDNADANTLCVTPRAPSRLRPKSAASGRSSAKPRAPTDNAPLGSSDFAPGAPVSEAGSNRGSVASARTSRSNKESCNARISRPAARAEGPGDGALSHSLSAADLLKETLECARPVSGQSRGSGKSRSAKGGSQRMCREDEAGGGGELTPALLPNASPNEVVSNWLQSIPTDNCVYPDGDEMNPEGGAAEEEAVDAAPSTREEDHPGDANTDKDSKTSDKGVEVEQEEQGKEEDLAKELSDLGVNPTVDEVTPSDHKALFQHSVSMSRNCHSSVAVMKVLLGPSLGRSNSLPEISPVYGRKLSTSAKGLLDCLAQLQLIQPLGSDPHCELHKERSERYQEVMTILQSLWLAGPKDPGGRCSPKDHTTSPGSSSGVEVGSGSGGSGKDHNDGEGGAVVPGSLPKDAAESAQGREEGDHDNPEVSGADVTAEAEVANALGAPTAGPDTPPSSSDKSSSAAGGSKSPTDNEQETPAEDSGHSTPPAARPSPLAAKTGDPDPAWALHLLRKLEKQFMSHYTEAMVEFKTRWELEDNVLLDTMISELRDEVGRRIQGSVGRELKKIQGRAGRGGRVPRPPPANLSRESTMTERRRQMLKVMKNQTPKTVDSLSDDGEFSDQRSDDEYCPCDACVRKKLAARPARALPAPATPAPVMADFDLRKILQQRRGPEPEEAPGAAAPSPEDDEDEEEEEEEEEKSLEVVQEEDEEEVEDGETEGGAVGDGEDGAEEGSGVQGTGGAGGGAGEEEQSVEGEEARDGEEEEEEEGEVVTDGTDEGDDSGGTEEQQEGEEEEKEEGEEEEEEEEEEEGEEEEEVCEDCMASDSKAEEEGETTEKEESGEKEEEASGEESTTAEEEEEEEEGGEEEDDEGEEPSCTESAPTATPTACATTGGEEADGEGSDTSGGGGANSEHQGVEEGEEEEEEEEEKEVAEEVQRLPRQCTRSSMESQSGSMEDLVSAPPAPPKGGDL